MQENNNRTDNHEVSHILLYLCTNYLRWSSEILLRFPLLVVLRINPALVHKSFDILLFILYLPSVWYNGFCIAMLRAFRLFISLTQTEDVTETFRKWKEDVYFTWHSQQCCKALINLKFKFFFIASIFRFNYFRIFPIRISRKVSFNISFFKSAKKQYIPDVSVRFWILSCTHPPDMPNRINHLKVSYRFEWTEKTHSANSLNSSAKRWIIVFSSLQNLQIIYILRKIDLSFLDLYLS